MTPRVFDLPDALISAGINVRFLDGWDIPYPTNRWWRPNPDSHVADPEADPHGHMWHHTASTGYIPIRRKANGWAGMGDDESLRLHQTANEDAYPVYVFATMYPAAYASGSGCKYVLEDYVMRDRPYTTRQGRYDDTPLWYGNSYYWNTEVVLDGIGSEMDPRLWTMLCQVAAIQNEVMGWTPARHIGHAMHTRRKIDLRDGRYNNMAETIAALRHGMEEAYVFTHYQIGHTYPEWETISWWLYMIEGGTIDANGHSGQIQTELPWKTNVRLVQAEDFDLIAELIGLSNANRIEMTDTGLYRFGKELASLRQKAYT